MNGETVGFTDDDRARARAYHRPLYLALLLDLSFAVGVLAVFAWSRVGAWLYPAVTPLVAAALYAAIVVAVSALVRLPLSAWRGWCREREWGFSTQPFGAWLGDWGKALAVNAVLAAAVWTVGVALARAWPGWWALPAAALLAVAVLLLSFVAPVVLEPLFNRFRPLEDAELATDLRAISEQAGVPVRDVLVADASRRTTKVNAYVSGIGATRRVVLYDTLLDSADEGQLKVVVAHELGHRRDGHVVKLTLLAMAGAAASVAVLWAVLGTRVAEP